jgi:uncharacterized iron-regulated protein
VGVRLCPAIASLLIAAAIATAAPAVSIEHEPDPEQIAAMLRLARGADVLGIGEFHDHPAHHAAQAQIVEALVAAGERPVLAFEMLTRDQQTAVDTAIGETLDVHELDRRLGWRARGWPDFAMYYPLFEMARRHRLPVLAADLDALSVRTVSRHGLGALGESDRAQVASRLSPDAVREQRLRDQLQVAHCGLLSPSAQASMAEAWHARNVTMAWRIVEALGRRRPVILITGRAHLSPVGVPGQIDALRPGTRVVVVDLVEAGTVELPNADVVWRTPARARPDRCDELRSRRLP